MAKTTSWCVVPLSAYKSWRSGISVRQKPHHDAQKLMITGLPRIAPRLVAAPLESWSAKSGARCPTLRPTGGSVRVGAGERVAVGTRGVGELVLVGVLVQTSAVAVNVGAARLGVTSAEVVAAGTEDAVRVAVAGNNVIVAGNDVIVAGNDVIVAVAGSTAATAAGVTISSATSGGACGTLHIAHVKTLIRQAATNAIDMAIPGTRNGDRPRAGTAKAIPHRSQVLVPG
jgi:hypothetical protein